MSWESVQLFLWILTHKSTNKRFLIKSTPLINICYIQWRVLQQSDAAWIKWLDFKHYFRSTDSISATHSRMKFNFSLKQISKSIKIVYFLQSDICTFLCVDNPAGTLVSEYISLLFPHTSSSKLFPFQCSFQNNCQEGSIAHLKKLLDQTPLSSIWFRAPLTWRSTSSYLSNVPE